MYILKFYDGYYEIVNSQGEVIFVQTISEHPFNELPFEDAAKAHLDSLNGPNDIENKGKLTVAEMVEESARLRIEALNNPPQQESEVTE